MNTSNTHIMRNLFTTTSLSIIFFKIKFVLFTVNVIFILGFTLLSLLLYLVKSSLVFLLVGMVFLGFLGASVADSKINK